MNGERPQCTGLRFNVFRRKIPLQCQAMHRATYRTVFRSVGEYALAFFVCVQAIAALRFIDWIDEFAVFNECGRELSRIGHGARDAVDFQFVDRHLVAAATTLRVSTLHGIAGVCERAEPLNVHLHVPDTNPAFHPVIVRGFRPDSIPHSNMRNSKLIELPVISRVTSVQMAQ